MCYYRSSSSGETDQTDISQENKSKSSEEEELIKKLNEYELNTRTSNNENESITTRKTGLTSISMYSSSSEDEEEDLNRQKQQ